MLRCLYVGQSAVYPDSQFRRFIHLGSNKMNIGSRNKIQRETRGFELE